MRTAIKTMTDRPAGSCSHEAMATLADSQLGTRRVPRHSPTFAAVQTPRVPRRIVLAWLSLSVVQPIYRDRSRSGSTTILIH
jgi:hypothetical protein